VSRAVLSVFPLSQDLLHPAAYMQVCNSAEGHRTAAQQAVVDIVVSQGFKAEQVEPVERYAFYEKIKGASLIVQSGEATAYGNALFCKGVILL
jgi:L-fucose mutarotase